MNGVYMMYLYGVNIWYNYYVYCIWCIYLGRFDHDLNQRPKPRTMMVNVREIIPKNGCTIQVSELE